MAATLQRRLHAVNGAPDQRGTISVYDIDAGHRLIQDDRDHAQLHVRVVQHLKLAQGPVLLDRGQPEIDGEDHAIGAPRPHRQNVYEGQAGIHDWDERPG